MKYFHHTLLVAFAAFVFVGCDGASTPVATIIGVDLASSEPGEFVEIQDVAGRAYARVETFPAIVDVQLYSEARDYTIVVLRPSESGGFEFVAASASFKAVDLTGSSFTTGGNVEAVLTLE